MHQLIDKKIKIYFYIFLLLILSSTYNSNFIKFLNDLFKIRIIEIENSAYKNEFNNMLNQNIFFIKQESITKTLIKFPIFEKFKINKIYPNKVRIQIFETKPIAKIYLNNELFIIGKNENIFKSNINHDEIPLIEGKYDKEKINSFLKAILSENFNLNLINKLILYPSNRWDIIYKDRTLIKLKNNNFKKDLKRVKILLEDPDFKKKVIDLRIKNRIIVSNE